MESVWNSEVSFRKREVLSKKNMQITKIDDLNMNLTILLISNIIIHMNKSKITYGEINDINLKSLLKRLSGI